MAIEPRLPRGHSCDNLRRKPPIPNLVAIRLSMLSGGQQSTTIDTSIRMHAHNTHQELKTTTLQTTIELSIQCRQTSSPNTHKDSHSIPRLMDIHIPIAHSLPPHTVANHDHPPRMPPPQKRNFQRLTRDLTLRKGRYRAKGRCNSEHPVQHR